MSGGAGFGSWCGELDMNRIMFEETQQLGFIEPLMLHGSQKHSNLNSLVGVL